MAERCLANKPWVGSRSHDCDKRTGHHGMHRCGCGERWLNEDDWTPCLSTAVAVLGVVGDPVRLRCGLQADHSEDHTFSMTWHYSNDDPTRVHESDEGDQ